jgi:hypothetical protein
VGLKRIDDGLWVVDSHFASWGCRVSIRMTVMKTEAGLLLHSPVHLEPDDVAAIGRLGPVHAIIAPNLYHHFHVRDCAALFPKARVLVPEGLQERIGPIARAEVMASDATVDLPNDVDHLVVAGHRMLRETLLFHRPTATLVTADLIYNYHAEHHLAEKSFFRLIGCYGAPKVAFYHAFSIQSPHVAVELIEVVRRWRPQRIVMSHGRIIEDEQAAELFAAAWMPFTR